MRFVGSMVGIGAMVGLTAGFAAPASAEPAANGGEFSTMYTLAQGPCVGTVNATVNGRGYPNAASFTVTHNLLGVGPCSLDVTLNWRNVDTGETGRFNRHIDGPGFGITDPASTIFYPGFGPFVGTVSINAGHLPESGEVQFTVDPYHD
ncbi:hypothetical protein ACFYV7_40125 [Nocardia suismassiliense]|uniref:Uncharacterized protein n=1 Tax=Nocardia suismassiliense TaxID=2077092 RepID=A0ABW6R8H1_9NOCA